MFESALLIRWFISFIVIILLLAAFYIALRIYKQKINSDDSIVNKNKMSLLDVFYIDSKNKIVKVKDGESILTILVGANASFIKSETSKDLEEK